MHAITPSGTGTRVKWRRLHLPFLQYPLRYSLICSLLVLMATAPAALADTAARAPANTSYRVIQLSPDPYAFTADVNARGQVAFTDSTDGVRRARLYDGRRLRDLGTLGGPGATAAAINDRGQVTGSADIAPDGSVSHAYLWQAATGMLDLARPGTGNSHGSDINARGEVTGTAVSDPAGNGQSRAFFWRRSTGMLDIGTLGAPFSFGAAINDAGTVAGTSSRSDGPNNMLGFRWTRSEGIRAIGTVENEFTHASGINNAGQIVGASLFPTGQYVRAFLWTPRAGLRELGTGTGTRSSATRINDRGMVIGEVQDPFLFYHGFVWTRETGMIEFGAGSGSLRTSADDLNNRGQVVGSYGERAYVWSRAQGVVDLNTRLAGAPDGLLVEGGLAISDNGSIVARANTGLVLLVPTAAPAVAPMAPVAAPITVTGTPRPRMLLSFSAPFTDTDLRDTHTATWVWGDGGKTVGTVSERKGAGSVSGQHAFRSPGTYTVRLTVTDNGGRSTTVQREVTVARHAGNPDGENPASAGAVVETQHLPAPE